MRHQLHQWVHKINEKLGRQNRPFFIIKYCDVVNKLITLK